MIPSICDEYTCDLLGWVKSLGLCVTQYKGQVMVNNGPHQMQSVSITYMYMMCKLEDCARLLHNK